MGRDLKRVPLDFAWPLKKTWPGYVNPHGDACLDCESCAGSGYSPQAKLFADQWYGNASFDPVEYGAVALTVDHPGVVAAARRNVDRDPGYYGRGEAAVRREAERLFGHWRGQWCHHLIQADVDALIAAGRLMDFTHTPRTPEQVEIVTAKVAAGDNSWLPESNGYVPTADEVNAWGIAGFGHDAINRWICIKARCKRTKVAVNCRACKGEGSVWHSDEAKRRSRAWRKYEPPKGDGYQLWESTSEGSPISPVFPSIEELCEYAAANCGTFGSQKTTASEWRRMLDAGFVAHVETHGHVTAVFT